MPRAGVGAILLAIGGALSTPAAQAVVSRPGAALDRAMAAAEKSLKAGELESAGSQYRTALLEGWLLMGSLQAVEGRLAEAAAAFRHASAIAPDTRALDALAWVQLRTEAAKQPAVAPGDVAALGGLSPGERAALAGRATTALTQAYLNLGVMHAQKQRFARAAEMFEQAAEVDPVFPRVQYSLGVARFNAQQFTRATGPLALALAADPGDAGLKRMLALAWLNTEAYENAAELLRDDPGREDDPSLQYAYGLALVRSDRAAEAEPIFARLLARHGDTAELNVLLGQAHAQQGDYEAAIRSLNRALELKPGVAEASSTLGLLYLKQGQLPEAEAALRAELASHPSDAKAGHDLAAVLDLEGRPEEALALLRRVLEARPDFAKARYLLGKVLLSQGAAAEATEQLEAAARLAPEDASVRYQLGQAYQKLGRTEAAREQFEAFQRLKDQRRRGPS